MHPLTQAQRNATRLNNQQEYNLPSSRSDVSTTKLHSDSRNLKIVSHEHRVLEVNVRRDTENS